MRRVLIVCALLLTGCAQSQPPGSGSSASEDAGGTATLSLVDLAGTWEGTITPAGRDSVLANVELHASSDPNGWTVRVTSASDPSMTRLVPATSVVAQGDSVIVEAGPFESMLRPGQQVTTHSVYRLQNGMLMGAHRTTYPASGESIMLESVASRQSM